MFSYLLSVACLSVHKTSTQYLYTYGLTFYFLWIVNQLLSQLRRNMKNLVTFFIALVLVPVTALHAVNAADRPNVLLVMVDDMGWSDLGCYGGEIETPHIDSLAENGLRFTRFYNNAVCGATRASLLTGLYCQQTGHRGDRWNEPKDYQRCVLIPEVLQANGYHTAMVGKWQGRDLAVERGFDRFFGPNCQGKISYWDPVVQNNFFLDDRPWSFPETGFFMTDAFNEYAVEFLEDAVERDDPFFLYVGYIAPHWPLHAREETIAPYRERYRTKGWDGWRQERLRRLRKMNLLPKDATPAARVPSIPDWSDDPHQAWQAERMAVYAAQISNVDRGIGRLLQTLEQSGQADNTLVLFLSDNGAAPNGGFAPTESGFGFSPGGNNSNWRRDRVAIRPGSGPDVMPGPHNTFAGYGLAWALTSNTPFRDTKQSAYEGGIRTPLIVRWPAAAGKKAEITQQPGHVIDIMATCLDVAGVEYPTKFRERQPVPLEGKSLVPIIRGEQREPHELIAWKCLRGRAIQVGEWKLVKPNDKQPWELYNLGTDIGETNNLADQFPERVEVMKAKYDQWRKRVGAK